MTLNCRPGDLAISVNTRLPENEGVIVQVVCRHVNTPGWNFGLKPTWWCASDEEMTWEMSDGSRIVAYEGPVPDAVLRPIRPPDEPEAQTTERELELTA